MLQAEALRLLNGSQEEQRELLNLLIEEALMGTISDAESAMLEFLKKKFLQPQVVELQATMKGSSGLI